MSQITVRGIDSEIERKIRKMARDKQKSINQVLREIISQPFENKKQKSNAASLGRLAGGWSEQDAAAFFDSIASCNQLDEAMWR